MTNSIYGGSMAGKVFSKDEMIRARLIAQGKIIPNAVATKDEECVRCKVIFKVLMNRFDRVCGPCSIVKPKKKW
jgi:hypothetical protein